MGNPLRDRRTPQELAASGQVIEIANKVGDFERLAGIVEADLCALDPEQIPPDWRNASIKGRLGFAFATAQERVPVLDGRLAATIAAVCQRCLAPFELPLELELRLAFSASQGSDEAYELWELEDDRLTPADIVEETLIMALPYIAVHGDDSACRPAAVPGDEAVRMTTPFANLKAQMEKTK